MKRVFFTSLTIVLVIVGGWLIDNALIANFDVQGTVLVALVLLAVIVTIVVWQVWAAQPHPKRRDGVAHFGGR